MSVLSLLARPFRGLFGNGRAKSAPPAPVVVKETGPEPELEAMQACWVARDFEELAKLAPENPEHMPVLGQAEYTKVDAWSEATALAAPG